MTPKFTHFLENKGKSKTDHTKSQKEIKSKIPDRHLIFDSNFESGNLELVEIES